MGGNREAIGTEEIGLVVPSKSPIELGKAILKLYKSKVRDKMGEKARSRVKSMFSLDRCIVDYEKLYLTASQTTRVVKKCAVLSVTLIRK